MIIPEYHVIEREHKSYIFLPQKKIFCEVTKEIGKVLREQHNKTKLTSDQENVVKEFMSLMENYSDAKGMMVDQIEGITMILATDCNLRCSYCYADEGTYHREKRLMTKETAIKAVHSLFTLFPSIHNVRFFGGEPLLNVKVIWEVCQYIEEQLGRNDVFYTLETNGTIASDELVKLANKYKFDISISCDGPEEFHNLHRKCCQGQGTYQKVINTVTKLKEEKIKFGFQCTYTQAHQDLTREELTKHLTQFSPFYKISPMITDETVVDLDQEFLFAPFEYLLTDQPLFHSPSIQIISAALSSINSIEFCEAQSRVTVFPDGATYPCEFLDRAEFYMGNVHDLDFPGQAYSKVRESLGRFKRDDLLSEYWFRYLVNPICIADVLAPDYNLNKQFTLSAKLEPYYEELIIKLIEIENSGRGELLKKNLDQYLKGSRVRYGTHK